MNKIYNGISSAAWGYFFIYFSINVNNVSIIPSFIGYLLLYSAITNLKEDESELSLLRPFVMVMALWHGGIWLASWGGVNLQARWQLLNLIFFLIDLYLHFQFLTNMAAIASRYQNPGMDYDDKLWMYRTVLVILQTIIMLFVYCSPWLAAFWEVITVVILIVNAIVSICLMVTLFGLRRSLQPDNQ